MDKKTEKNCLEKTYWKERIHEKIKNNLFNNVLKKTKEIDEFKSVKVG